MVRSRLSDEERARNVVSTRVTDRELKGIEEMSRGIPLSSAARLLMNVGLSLLRHGKLDQDGDVRVPVRGFSPDASSDLDMAWEKMDEDDRFRQLHPGPIQASIEEAIRKRKLRRRDGLRFTGR